MQRYLIDTQILIWSLISPSKLSADILKLMSSNVICVSQISLFEIAIKQKVNKLPELQISIEELEETILNDGFKVIPITMKHITNYNTIPLFDNHRDPFDRLILAIAFSERASIISADKNFKLYNQIVDLIEA